MQQSSAIDTSLLNNSSYAGGNSYINSPQNQANMPMMQFKKNPNLMINNTESTNVNSDMHKGSKSMPHKQQQFWKHEEQKQSAAMIDHQNQQLSMQLQNSSVGSGGPNHMLDDSQRRDLILKNAKSLGNSLGTANKKSLNMSNHCDKMLQGIVSQGID